MVVSAAGLDMRDEAAGFVTQLFDWAAAATPIGTTKILKRAATILADDIAAMVAASTETPVMKMSRPGLGDEAAVFSAAYPARKYSAAAAEENGLAATWCELDEGARSVPCHAGAYVLPVLLAESERLGLTTADVLQRLIVAYEVVVRVARAFVFPVMRTHPHALWAAFGASVGASLARGHDRGTLMMSASGGVSMAFAGPFGHAVDGALVRNAWTSAGARLGLMCADLAEAGIGGIAHSFHDSLVTALGGRYVPTSLSDLGDNCAVSDGYHKSYACCQYAHSAVEATIALRREFASTDGDVGTIEAILVETHPRGETLTAVEPPNTLSAKFSMPHAAAAAAVFGNGGQAAFDEAALVDPAVVALRRKVMITAHPSIGAPPYDRPARVTWLLQDGRAVSAECRSAVGGADRPLEHAALVQKFRDLTGSAFPEMADRFVAMIELDPATLAQPWRRTVDQMMGF